MPRHLGIGQTRRSLLVLSLAAVVHATFIRGAAADTVDKLPTQVLEMRDAILAAIHAGEIEELRFAIELNELKPDFGGPPGSDPIDYLKAQSTDGQGREILANIANTLAVGHAVRRTGADIENNRMFVWPYLAELELDKLTAPQKVDLYRLVPVQKADAMLKTKTWDWWRLSIGADGVWHSFSREH